MMLTAKTHSVSLFFTHNEFFEAVGTRHLCCREISVGFISDQSSSNVNFIEHVLISRKQRQFHLIMLLFDHLKMLTCEQVLITYTC